MNRYLALAYGLFCYVVFLGTAGYLAAWLANVIVSRPIDGSPEGAWQVAVVVNLLLVTVFAAQHSVMARPAFKKVWTQFVPQPIERSTYVLFTNLVLVLLFWQWRPMGGEIWNVENGGGRAVIYGLYIAGWLTVLATTCLINHFDLFGLRQVWLYFRGQPYTPLRFVTPGPYRLMRHPLYVGWITVFWATPTMTTGHLVFALASSVYILVAIQFEERNLAQFHGESYDQYRRNTPMLIPIRWNALRMINQGNRANPLGWLGRFRLRRRLFGLLAIATITLSLTHPTRPLLADEASAEDSKSNVGPRRVELFPGFDGYSRSVTTESAAAQRWFDQGIQLLYGFNHDEAVRSFEKAARLDPGCAMAWWGAAYARGLHINNPEMTEQQSRLAYQASQEALAALDSETPVEAALVRAVAERYTWPAPEDRAPWDKVYARVMEETWHQFPDDPDVGALYAESLMNLQPWDLWTSEGAPKGRVLEVVAVLERTLAKTPQHPGANHFYIHAIEASPWPERGTEAAERLKDLVPGSGHLVHMPSHIFIRTGRYAEAADANQRAIQADERYFKQAPEPAFYSLYYLHNVHFLAYSAMMEGRYRTAIEAARKIEKQIPESFLKDYVEIADGFMPTALHVMIRFGKWDAILAEPEPPQWRLLSRAERRFARSVAFSAKGETNRARRELEALEQLSDDLTDEWKVGNNSASEVLAVARAMAAGELAFRENQPDRAFRLLRKAVRLEEQLSYDEPPGWMQPVRHALGALLLADGRHAEAEEVYRADLKRHPNNAWALLGLQQSLGLQGKTEAASALDEVVARAWARADVQPVASCYCHPAALLVP